MPTDNLQFREALFVEQVANKMNFDTLAKALPVSDIYPPYLFLATLILIDLGFVNTYLHFTGATHALIDTPMIITAPLGLVLAAFGIRYMSDRYANVIRDLHIEERVQGADVKKFERLIPLRFKIVGYGIAVFLLYLHIVINIGISNVIEIEGTAALINWFVIWPLYLTFVVEFTFIYFGIHFLVPRRISRTNLGLFFYDPRNMGGFGTVGELLKRSYYLYTGGLLLYVVLVYGPATFSFGQTPGTPGLVDIAFFSSAWLVGIISIGYSMLTMHRIMSGEKEDRIGELEKELRKIVDNPYNINSSGVTDQDQWDDVSRRLEEVRNTRTYPATFAMWSQILISVISPQVLQIAIQAGV